MISILATGSCLPEHVLTNDDLSKRIDTSDEWISSRTGIKQRHIALKESALDLARDAANRALDGAGIKAEDLGLIVCATLTGDHLTPSLACELMMDLGASCTSFDINAACSGFLYALDIARKLMDDKPTLVVACEMLSRVVNWEDRSTCVLFGDGAGAAVLANTEGDRGIIDISTMAYPDTKGTLKIPGINFAGGRSYVTMDGGEVYKFATRALAGGLRDILEKNGFAPADVKWFVPHQANIRIIRTAASLLDVDMDRFYTNIDRTGNTSAASVAIALDELKSQLVPGNLLALSAFGGGLTSASALVRW